MLRKTANRLHALFYAGFFTAAAYEGYHLQNQIRKQFRDCENSQIPHLDLSNLEREHRENLNQVDKHLSASLPARQMSSKTQ